jgi:hypothetical protein
MPYEIIRAKGFFRLRNKRTGKLLPQKFKSKKDAAIIADKIEKEERSFKR